MLLNSNSLFGPVPNCLRLFIFGKIVFQKPPIVFLVNRNLTLLFLFLLTVSLSGCTSNTTKGKEENSSEWIWANQPPAEGSSIIEPRYAETAVGPGGNIYFLTTLTAKINGKSRNRLHLSCYNPAGKELWVQEYPGQVVAQSLSIDANGDLWTAGTFKGYLKLGDRELNASDKPTWFIAKFRKLNGKCLIAKGGERHSSFVFGRLAANGKFWVAGNYDGVFPSGIGEWMHGRQTQGFLRCFDSEGNPLWKEKIATQDFVRVIQMRPLENGAMLLGGTFESDLQIGEQKLNPGGYMEQEGFMAYILPDGKTKWLQQIGSIDPESYTTQVTDGIIDILPDEKGGIYIAGKLHDQMIFGPDTIVLPPYGEDCYLAYRNNLGEFLWGRRVSGTHGGGNALTLAPDGNIWVTGFYQDSLWLESFQLTDSLRNENCYLAEFDQQGHHLRHTLIHGESAMGFFHVRNLIHTGDLIIASGHKPRSVQFGDITLERDCRYYNAFLAAYRPN